MLIEFVLRRFYLFLGGCWSLEWENRFWVGFVFLIDNFCFVVVNFIGMVMWEVLWYVVWFFWLIVIFFEVLYWYCWIVCWCFLDIDCKLLGKFFRFVYYFVVSIIGSCFLLVCVDDVKDIYFVLCILCDFWSGWWLWG